MPLTPRRDFGPFLEELRAARRFVSETADRWDIGGLVNDARQVTSELAANAVTHGRSAFSVCLHRDDHRLVVEVADDNPRPPTVAAPPVGALSGRGLVLVQALARAWGVRQVPRDGKVVWAELATDSAEGDQILRE